MQTGTATTHNGNWLRHRVRIQVRIPKARWTLLLCATVLAVGGCATFGTVEVPADWPEHLPLYPEATILDAQFDPALGASITLVTSDDPEKARVRYTTMLRGSGWKMRGQRADERDNLVVFADHRAQKRSLTVMFTPEGGGTKLTLLEAPYIPLQPGSKRKKALTLR